MNIGNSDLPEAMPPNLSGITLKYAATIQIVIINQTIPDNIHRDIPKVAASTVKSQPVPTTISSAAVVVSCNVTLITILPTTPPTVIVLTPATSVAGLPVTVQTSVVAVPTVPFAKVTVKVPNPVTFTLLFPSANVTGEPNTVPVKSATVAPNEVV